jgi:hypothetical protein
MPLILVLAALLVLASIGWLASSKTSQAAPTPPSEDPFKGKVLLVRTQSTSVFLLESAQVEKMSALSWLMGKGVSDEQRGRLYKGRTVRIRMEDIESIAEFDDVEAANKALKSGAWTFGLSGVPRLLPPRDPIPPGKG